MFEETISAGILLGVINNMLWGIYANYMCKKCKYCCYLILENNSALVVSTIDYVVNDMFFSTVVFPDQ